MTEDADPAVVAIAWFFAVWFVVAAGWTTVYILRWLRSLLHSDSFISTDRIRIFSIIKLPKYEIRKQS